MLKLPVAMTSFALLLMAVSPALAADTAKIYNSGLLVLLFVGFCALLIVVQVLPAMLSLLGLTKKAASSAAQAKMQTIAVKKH